MTTFAADEPGRARRSLVLRSATWLANAYLIAFALDALLSAAEAVVGMPAVHALASSHPALHSALVGEALTVLVASLVIPFLLLFVPQLPKLPFVPMLVFMGVAWASFLRRGLFGGPVMLWLDWAEPLVAAATFLLLKARTGGWLLASSRLPRKRHLVVRTIFATVVTIAVVPVMTAALIVLVCVATLERSSDGHLHVTGSGVVVRETVLTKDGRTVLLVPMVHFGEGEFYRTIFEEIPPGSLVLAEGITDREKRLAVFPSAMKLASALGLTTQPDPRVAVRPGAPPPIERGSEPTASSARPEVVIADVDMAEFSDATIAVLRDLAGFYDSGSFGEALRRLVARTRARDGFATVKGDLIDKRNAKLLQAFDERASGYTTIVIPWGAMHVPGLEAGLRERGYRVDAERERTVMRFPGAVAWLIGFGDAHSAGSP